jgi:hypothetical protein
MLVVQFFRSCVHVVRESFVDWRAQFPALVSIVYLVLGLALYLVWQTGDGLTPGKNSSIKASYNAYLIAFAVVIPFLKPMGTRALKLWLVWATAVAAATLPLIVFWPFWPLDAARPLWRVESVFIRGRDVRQGSEAQRSEPRGATKRRDASKRSTRPPAPRSTPKVVAPTDDDP